MPTYITTEDIELTVKGKIRFTDDPNNEERMSYDLLERLMEEAEADVELELSVRYKVPFVGQDGATFANLPNTTKRLIQLMCRMRTVQLLMDTDFGAGSALDGENFVKGYIIQYNSMRKKAIAKREDGWGWMYPPLPNLQLAHGNHAADDGYQGAVLSTSQGDGGYPAGQINDPSEGFWNSTLDET